MDKINKLKEITKPIEKDLDSFEMELKNIINAEDNFLRKDLYDFMFTNPKRLRPIFVFLFAKILNINNVLTKKIALISELVHNASLIHDDIIDEEKIRRLKPTFYEKYGSKIAVLEGDLLLTLTLEKLSDTTKEISKIFSEKIKKTLNGELLQNQNNKKITDIETYLKKTQGKTGNLFFAGLESLFSLDNFDENLKNNLYSFLKNYTLAYQINNDIENFKKDATDSQNGNYTLPMIYFFMENHSLEYNKENIKKYIDKSIQKVEELKHIALSNLQNIKHSAYKQALIDLTNFTLRS